MRHRPYAMTLVEALVAMVIFIGLMAITVAVFQFGVNSARLSAGRADLQSLATRTMYALQNDLRRTNGNSLTQIARSITLGANQVRRDAVCMVGMSDWGTATYSSGGVPNFDRYTVYYATTDDAGKMVRSALPGPSPPDPTSPPLTGFSLATNCQEPPDGNLNQLQFTVLAEEVRDFRMQELSDGRVQAALHLLRPAVAAPGGTRSDQSFEMVIEVRPANTFPP